jgi:hypothetical protein
MLIAQSVEQSSLNQSEGRDAAFVVAGLGSPSATSVVWVA